MVFSKKILFSQRVSSASMSIVCLAMRSCLLAPLIAAIYRAKSGARRFRVTPRGSSGCFARSGCNLLQNRARDFLHLAETRKVILKFAVQIERERSVKLCTQDHIAQMNRMRQYRVVP